MTEALEVAREHKVLEIGTGSGYQAAVLAEIAREVFTIEIVEPLAERSRDLLDELGYRNVHVRAGNGYLGGPRKRHSIGSSSPPRPTRSRRRSSSS